MIRVRTTDAPWRASLRISLRCWPLILCLAIVRGNVPAVTHRESSQNSAHSPGYQFDADASILEHDVPLPPSGYGDLKRGFDNSLSETFKTPQQPSSSFARVVSEQISSVIVADTTEVSSLSDRRPTPSRRSFRQGESREWVQTSPQSQSEKSRAKKWIHAEALSEERDGWKVDGPIPSKPHNVWMATGTFPTRRALADAPQNRNQDQVESNVNETDNEEALAFGESADPRRALETLHSLGVPGDSVSIPSPLAHSLLYRTRDISNPLNFANFLAEGQEWLIPGSGSLWEGLGRRVDSLFSGLFLKTASILPDYTRNVIICYREYKPSMWIEMLGLRNRFLRQLASLFQGTHRMQSVYLRNLGMEIFEVPPLWRVGEFVATVLKLKSFVSHVYTDHLVTDFDNEAQTPLRGKHRSQNFSKGSSDQSSPGKRGFESTETSRGAPKNIVQHRISSPKSAPRRRLEVMTNDPYTWQQWAIVDSGPSRWGIEAPNAWELWTGLGLRPRFTVAVIDSGVDYEHPDLKNQIWRNPDEICGNGIDDDFNGFVDDCIGWDFVKGTSMPMDENGHGTASAGIIAAEPNNGIGLTGVCWGCDILVLKALNEDIKGTISAFARSLDYAIGKGVVLSNNSYGGRGSGFKGLEEAVHRARQAGMIVVAAAGNYNGNNDNDKQPVFPASYDLDNIVSVAAISRNGQLAPFSSYGKKQVDVAAPGANIMTTSAQKSYRSVSGTSFAVPMVTGTLALLWTRRPHLNYRQVIQRLLRSVKKNPNLEGLIATGGTVDAWNTLASEDFLDPYAASPVLPMTCVSASCSPYASCTDVRGTARCVCNRGFEGDGKVCKDIDECIFSPCGPASVCVNTVGSYQCKCRKGFQQTLDSCIDIDECALGLQKLIPQPCPLQARCYNFSGTFDCICPQGTVWNGLSGPAAQCLRINSPDRGPCAGNGGCGVNALCQAFFTAARATRKCGCISGFKPLRIGNQEVAAAMASSQMSSFDNTVCIRENVLPEEQAYYLISMHRERLRSLRESPEGHLTAGYNVPKSGQSGERSQAPTSSMQPAELYRSPAPSKYFLSAHAPGLMNHSWGAAGVAPLPTPGNSDVKIPHSGSLSDTSGVQLPTKASPGQVPYSAKQRVVSFSRGSCLLGVCFQ